MGAGHCPWVGYTDGQARLASRDVTTLVPKFKDLVPTVLAGKSVYHERMGWISIEYKSI